MTALALLSLAAAGATVLVILDMLAARWGWW